MNPFFFRAEKNGVFFLRRVELWIIDFRSETAELALPEKFAASGGEAQNNENR